jgi:hypothetical protein
VNKLHSLKAITVRSYIAQISLCLTVITIFIVNHTKNCLNVILLPQDVSIQMRSLSMPPYLLPSNASVYLFSLLWSEGSFQTTTIPNGVMKMIFVCWVTISLRTISESIYLQILSLSLKSLGFHLVCYWYYFFFFFLIT